MTLRLFLKKGQVGVRGTWSYGLKHVVLLRFIAGITHLEDGAGVCVGKIGGSVQPQN